MKRISKELEREILDLRIRGYTQLEIARKTGLIPPTVRKYLHKYGIYGRVITIEKRIDNARFGGFLGGLGVLGLIYTVFFLMYSRPFFVLGILGCIGLFYWSFYFKNKAQKDMGVK